MIHFSESFERFLRESDSRIAHILFSAKHSSYQAWQLYLTDRNINYLAHREDGTISFLPAGKEHKVNEAGKWSKEGRQNGKPAKVLRKLFTDRALKLIKASEFEKFGNQYKASFCMDGYTFKLLPHTEIANVYCQKQRAAGGASLNSSCMNGDRSFLGIYNDKQISILTLWDKDDLLAGRALVWTIGDKVIMDRIYVSCDFMYDMFINEAERNKWYHKIHYSTYEHRMDFYNTATDKKEELSLRVYLNTDHDEFPYIDTFHYGKDGWLSNSDSDGWDYRYDETNGERYGDDGDRVWDDINEEYLHVAESSYIDSGERRFRDRTTRSEDVVYIGTCTYHVRDSGVCEVTIGRRANRGWQLVENCVNIDGEWADQEDAVFDEISEEDILNEDSITTSDDGSEGYDNKTTHINDTVVVDGERYHKEDPKVIKIDGDWVFRSTIKLAGSPEFTIDNTPSDKLVKRNGYWYSKDDTEFIMHCNGLYELSPRENKWEPNFQQEECITNDPAQLSIFEEN